MAATTSNAYTAQPTLRARLRCPHPTGRLDGPGELGYPMSGGDIDRIRPTTVGPFSSREGSGNRPRIIPVPWIDCAACGWRHYPSTAAGRWHIATHCAGCGGQLAIPAETPELPSPNA